MSAQSNALKNSRRQFEKVSYTPLKTHRQDDDSLGDALGRAALVRSLQITPGELGVLRDRLGSERGRAALETVAGIVNAISASRAVTAASELTRIPDAELIAVARELKTMRNAVADRLAREIAALDQRFGEAQKETSNNGYRQPLSGGYALAGTEADPHLSNMPPINTAPRPGESSLVGYSAAGYVSAPALLAAPPSYTAAMAAQLSACKAPAPLAAGMATGAALHRTDYMAEQRVHPLVALALGPGVASRAPSALEWAAKVESAKMNALIDEARLFLPASLAGASTDLLTALSEIFRRRFVVDLFIDSLTRRALEPVGLLHLERMEMTPLEIERGELLYSLPLAPLEKVTLAHREWTVRQEEFTELIEDFLENFSERGVSESEDIATSTETQTRHSNILSMSQSPVATSPVTMTTPVDTTTNQNASSVEDETSKRESRERSRAVTSKASARTIQDHKVSFTVTTVSGTEDFTARVIENPNKDQSMLVDYYRRMRRWRTDLYRYGVRMTYDVTLPDPGRDLRRRLLEISAIESLLSRGFQFDLKPSDITPSNWAWLGDQRGVILPPPPELDQGGGGGSPINYQPVGARTLQVVKLVSYPQSDPNNVSYFEEVHLQVPGEFRLTSLTASVDVGTWQEGNPPDTIWVQILVAGKVSRHLNNPNGWWIRGDVTIPLNSVPQFDDVAVGFRLQHVMNGELRLTAHMTPTETTYAKWLQACWTLLHEAAYAEYLQQRDRLRERRAALLKDVGAADALTLRRMEREQIMRCVLEWLFPGFGDANSVLTNAQYPGSLDADTWQAAMEYGEYIKFVQTAIDWDNVTVLLYPYFWDTALNQEQKLFLDHPDPIHREFLRAGAARIVLTIKPGFEEEVVSLLDQGQLGLLPDGHRFKMIVDQVREANAAYSETTRPAPGLDEDNPRVPGKLIGSWIDYTPTSALDIDVTFAKARST